MKYNYLKIQNFILIIFEKVLSHRSGWHSVSKTTLVQQSYPPAAEAVRAPPHHGAPIAAAHAPHTPLAPHTPHPPISEAEFEEVMSRNRTVSSSAIARAVSDAAAGEYASAIETLVTAISLIKQSKVSD